MCIYSFVTNGSISDTLFCTLCYFPYYIMNETFFVCVSNFFNSILFMRMDSHLVAPPYSDYFICSHSLL